MKPRHYQNIAVDSIFKYFANGGRGNPIVAMPGGTGKSVVIAEFVRKALMTYPSTRVMKLTHVKELVAQNLSKILKIWPSAPAGVYSAGLKRKDVGFPIVFGGVASVAKAEIDLFGRIDLLLIDECHLVSPDDDTMYRAIIATLKLVNPHLKVVGFTATPYRAGQGLLTDGDGIFTDICIDMTSLESFNWFLEEGYLSPLIPKPTRLELDTTGVHTSGGDFKLNELQNAVDKDDITYAALCEVLEHADGRNHWLVFASGVHHVENVDSMLSSLGIATTYVHSKMKEKERDKNIADYAAGKYRAMVNNGVLTTGYDYPNIDLLVILRPTKSAPLWVQILSRGTRPVYADGFDLELKAGRLAAMAAGPKQDCLVLDFARNTPRLGPINDPVMPRKRGKGGGGEAPIRLCETCMTYVHASLTFCPHCGTEFPRYVQISSEAGSHELIAKNKKEPILEVFKVDRVVYAEQQRDGKPPYLQVSYFCGLRMFKSPMCLEHEGYASRHARIQWRERAGDEPPPPDTIAEAVTRLHELRTPTHIRVNLNSGKFDEIMAYDYSNTAFGSVANGI